MDRDDYAFPFRVDVGSGQAARAGYPEHVDQLIRQVLLTAPGERVCLAEFGCGLRQLLFAPQSEALTANVRIQVRRSVERWLADQVRLLDVDVRAGADSATGLGEGEMLVTVSYVLVDTLAQRSVQVKVV